MKNSASICRILVFTLALIMTFSLCSCTVSVSSSSGSESQTSSNESFNFVEKYEFQDISVDSITAVVGNKGSVSAQIDDDQSDSMRSSYKYSDLTDSDIKAYGEYLLQNGFEEIQTNVFSKSTQAGATMKITLDGNSVVVEGEIIKQS